MGRTSDSRLRLMDAAHELIWGYSYGAVTIEAICDRAKVKKGSFYYFFDSKSDLALASINAWWDERRALVAEWFRPEVPPLERLQHYLNFVAERQITEFEKSGQVLGCPLFTLGAEICYQDERILALVQEIMTTGVRLFEQAVFDAQVRGDIDGRNATTKARHLWAFYEGTLTRARIENNPELLRNLCADAMELIGVKSDIAIAA